MMNSKLQNYFEGKRLHTIIVINLVFLSIFALLCSKCVEKYFGKTTSTADHYVHTSKVIFPELTLCPTYPYKLDILHQHGIKGRNSIQLENQWISNYSHVTPEHFYSEVTLQIHEIVHSVKIHLEQPVDGQNIFQVHSQIHDLMRKLDYLPPWASLDISGQVCLSVDSGC